jgi:hypothetical protein
LDILDNKGTPAAGSLFDVSRLDFCRVCEICDRTTHFENPAGDAGGYATP